MKREPLEVVHSRVARSAWSAAVKRLTREHGFKRGAQPSTGLPAWIRETDDWVDSFGFQVHPYGFDKYRGCSFVVGFTAREKRRGGTIYERMWRLLDDASRSEAFAMNNRVIESLPGPRIELMQMMSEPERAFYLKRFKTVDQLPSPDHDVWFKYATRADVDWWGEFVAARIPRLLAGWEDDLTRLCGPDSPNSERRQA